VTYIAARNVRNVNYATLLIAAKPIVYMVLVVISSGMVRRLSFLRLIQRSCSDHYSQMA
jgi:hypothetical protein